jgi:hypothetical protein
VSAVDLNELRQLDGFNLDRIFTDKASGKGPILSAVTKSSFIYQNGV